MDTCHSHQYHIPILAILARGQQNWDISNILVNQTVQLLVYAHGPYCFQQ